MVQFPGSTIDIVAISDSYLGLSDQWVRIIEITEQDDGSLVFVAEEYLNGTGNAPAYSFQSNDGFNADYNSAPSNANTPLIFEPPIQISQTGGLEVDIACSGQTNWGGLRYLGILRQQHLQAGRQSNGSGTAGRAQCHADERKRPGHG